MDAKQNLGRVLKQAQNYSRAYAGAIAVFRFLKQSEAKKAQIIHKMIQEAKDYKKLGKMRLVQDTDTLLKQFKEAVLQEFNYIYKLSSVEDDRGFILLELKRAIVPLFPNPQPAKDFFETLEVIHDLFMKGFNKRCERDTIERQFVDQWESAGFYGLTKFFETITFRRSSVVRKFKKQLLNLLERYRQEAIYMQTLIKQLEGTKELIAEKTKVLLEHARSIPDEAIRKALTVTVSQTAEETTQAVKSSQDFFNFTTAVVGDLLDDSKINMSTGFIAGGFWGALDEEEENFM